MSWWLMNGILAWLMVVAGATWGGGEIVAMWLLVRLWWEEGSAERLVVLAGISGVILDIVAVRSWVGVTGLILVALVMVTDWLRHKLTFSHGGVLIVVLVIWSLGLRWWHGTLGIRGLVMDGLWAGGWLMIYWLKSGWVRKEIRLK